MVHFKRLGGGVSEQCWALLRYCAALPHAAVRHHLHRFLQVEDEQAAGLPHVPAVLRLPHRVRHAGRQNHRLSSVHLSVRLLASPTPNQP